MVKLSSAKKKSIFQNKTYPFVKKQHMTHPFWSSYILGIRFELLALPEYLQPGETLYAVAQGQYQGANSLIAITSKRVLILDRGWLGGLFKKKKDEAYYNSINGTNPSAHFFLTDLLITTNAGMDDMEIKRLWGKDADRIDDALTKARQSYISHDYNNEETSSTDSSPSNLKEKLKKLEDFRKDGTISESDYKELKKELLNKL